MRILHVNKFLYRRGGAEVYALDVGALQREQGHEVEFWGMQHPDNPGYPLERTFPSYVEFEPPPAHPVDKVRLLARMVHSTEARHGMAAAIEAFRPDVVHLHNIYHQLSPSILSALRAARVPAVMTLHDYKLVCPTYSLLDGAGQPCVSCVDGGLSHAVRKRCGGSRAAGAAAAVELRIHRATDAYGHVARFLCPSQFLADMIQRAGVYRQQAHVLRNYVDVRDLPLRAGASRSVVYVGRLSHEKGVDLLVRAAPLLPSDVTVHIAGTGPDEEELHRLADQVAPGRVTFLGRLPREGVAALLSTAGVSVVPSRGYENQPLSLLEAFGCGVPVVAARHGGLVELIEPGGNGELVEPENPAALAAGITGVLSDPLRNAAMGAAARRTAERDHAPWVHVQALDGHYEAVQEQLRAADRSG